MTRRLAVRAAAFLLGGVLLAFCSVSFAAADGSQLKLPAGVAVGIVVFEDLQCPDCARVHPLLLAAAKANDVPVVIHDFPIPRHAWAFPAAVFARYFTTQSPELGVEFRTFIFSQQPGITPANLRAYAEKFAADHGQQLPGDIDPNGALMAQVQADFDLARQIKLEYVPLVFVLGASATGASRFVEVKEPEQLGAVIEQMKKGTAR